MKPEADEMTDYMWTRSHSIITLSEFPLNVEKCTWIQIVPEQLDPLHGTPVDTYQHKLHFIQIKEYILKAETK